MFRFLVGFLAFILTAANAFSQCDPNGCPINGMQAYQWVRSETDSDSWGLLRLGRQVGAWRKSTNRYRPLVNGQWGVPCAAPADLPVKSDRSCSCCGENCLCAKGSNCGRKDCPCALPGAVIESDGSMNFGVVTGSIRGGKHFVNGEETSKEKLFETLERSSLIDDSKEMYLTVIGKESDRKAVLADLASSPALSAWKAKLRVHDYDPTHWAVREAGFVTDGCPTIYCQAADGKVLHRQSEYRGPEALAEALRNADASYHPSSDPDRNNASWTQKLEAAWKELGNVPAWAWVLIAFVVYLRFGHKEIQK